MKSAPDPLALPLRDIHLPPPPAWWPPAPGWWLLGAALVLLPLLVTLGWQWRRRSRLRRAALQELAALRGRTDSTQLASDAALLLRRISLALDPARHHVALTGDAWLARLRAIAPGLEDPDLADALLRAPYAAQVPVDGSRLLTALERWIRALPTSARRQRELAAAPAERGHV